MLVPRVVLERIWEVKRHTRLGQVEMCVFLGFVFGLSASLSTQGLSPNERFWGGVVAGVLVSILTILVAVVSSIYLEYIEKRKANGRQVFMHRLALGLYWVVVLPTVLVLTIALLMDKFGL